MATPIDFTSNANHTEVQRFVGFNVVESVSAAAEVKFRRGTVAGQLLAHVTLSAGQSAIWHGSPQECVDGCYVEVVSGTVSGLIYSL